MCYASPIYCSFSKMLNKAQRKHGHLKTLYTSLGLKKQAGIQWIDILLWSSRKGEPGMQLFWRQVIFATLGSQVWLWNGGDPASELMEVPKIQKLLSSWSQLFCKQSVSKNSGSLFSEKRQGMQNAIFPTRLWCWPSFCRKHTFLEGQKAEIMAENTGE